MRVLFALCAAAGVSAIERPACDLQDAITVGEVKAPAELPEATYGGGFVLQVEFTLTAAPTSFFGSALVELFARGESVTLGVDGDLTGSADVTTSLDGKQTSATFGTGGRALELNKRTTLIMTAVPDDATAAKGQCYLYLEGVEEPLSKLGCGMLATLSRQTFVARSRLGLGDPLAGTLHGVRLQACEVVSSITPAPTHSCTLQTVFNLTSMLSMLSLPHDIPPVYAGGAYKLVMEVTPPTPLSNDTMPLFYSGYSVDSFLGVSLTKSGKLFVDLGKQSNILNKFVHPDGLLQAGKRATVEVEALMSRECVVSLDGQVVATVYQCDLPELQYSAFTIGGNSLTSVTFEGTVQSALLRVCELEPYVPVPTPARGDGPGTWVVWLLVVLGLLVAVCVALVYWIRKRAAARQAELHDTPLRTLAAE